MPESVSVKLETNVPVPMRDGGHQPLAAPAASARSCHFGGGSGFVEEDQFGGIEKSLPETPVRPCLGDVGSILFSGVRGFF